jgi:predicted P-loop ATPase
MAREKLTVLAGGKKDGGSGDGPGGGFNAPEDWRAGLVRTNSGAVKGLSHNLMLILEHDAQLADLFWLDEFGNRIVLERTPPWSGGTREEFTEVDALELSAWLGNPARYTMAVGIDLVLQCVEAIARRKKRHTVREYLERLKWDGVPRVARMFVDLFAADESAYVLGAAPCFLVSAVSRILWSDPTQPTKGSKVDFMIVLEGEQGAGKTTSVLELFGAEWYAEATESPAHKDFYQTLRGRWGVEIGEMDSFSKADVAKVKQAITTRFDVYRPSYGRTARAFRRECVFVGTNNQDDYLRDATGARRFLPVRIGRADVAGLVAVRDQLWAEAVTLYRDGFEWWQLPPGAKREQDARYSEDVWTESVIAWVEGRAPAGHYEGISIDAKDKDGRILECSASELLSHCLRIDMARHDRTAQMRLGSIMRRLGWDKYRPQRLGERIWCYYRPPEAERA